MKSRFLHRMVAMLLAVLFLLAVGCSSPPTAPAPAAPAKTAPAAPATPAAPAAPAPAKAAAIPAKLAHVGAPDHIFEVGAKKFAELVSTATNGAVAITTYPGSALGADRDTFEGVKMGTIEFNIQGPLDSFLPIASAISLPYMYKSSAHVYKFLDSDLAYQKIYKGLEPMGIICLSHMENGWRLITSNKPVKTVADMKGMKIRTPESKAWTDLFKALGANPVPIAFNELYSALQQGVADGQENPTAHIKTQRFYEVQKYLALSRHMYLDAPLLVSAKFWAKLSADQQAAVKKAAQEAADYQRKVATDREAEELKFLKDKGMTITEPDVAAFSTATEPVRKAWADKYGKDLFDQIAAMG